MAVDQSVIDGVMERVRAVLITGIAAIGFVPMVLTTGQGAEVPKPLAIVVTFGLITATLLTLFVLPAISHLLLHGRGIRRALNDLLESRFNIHHATIQTETEPFGDDESLHR